jgi:hypothetical protein
LSSSSSSSYSSSYSLSPTNSMLVHP